MSIAYIYGLSATIRWDIAQLEAECVRRLNSRNNFEAYADAILSLGRMDRALQRYTGKFSSWYFDDEGDRPDPRPLNRYIRRRKKEYQTFRERIAPLFPEEKRV